MRCGQCRKCRTPVNTIATPRSSAASITSWSRIEPPGWITAARAGIDHHVEAVAEREERVRRHRRTLQRQAGVRRLDRRDPRRVDAAHLPGADAQGHAAAAEHDRVRLDELGHPPGEHQVLRAAAAVGCFLVTTRRSARPTVVRVRRLHQQAAADALEVHPVARPRPASICSRRTFCLAAISCQRGFARTPGAISTSTNCFATAATVGFVHRPVEGDDAAEGRRRIGRERAPVAVQRIRADRHAAGIGMLDDDAGGRIERLDAFPGRVGVGDVVVGQFLALQLAVVGERAGRRRRCRGRTRPSGAGSRRSASPAPCATAGSALPDSARAAAARQRPSGQVVGDGAVVVRRCARRPSSPARSGWRSRRRRAPSAARARRRSRPDRTTTVTASWFLAAARSMAGPPMSMFSIASSSVQSGRATVCWNG